MTMESSIGVQKLAVLAGACALWAPFLVLAQDVDAIEEVIVTAQRTAESIQDVPIAVTALTGGMLEDRQVINPSDLQMNAPSVSFTATNFGNSSFSIRGIGRLVIGVTGEAGVSAHLNEIPVATNLNTIEFFDMERVEILRGPQGTLYGRNATGGAINFVTALPEFESAKGFLDVEAGDYSHRRVKGMLNIPLGDTAALRLGGFKLDRDGYTKNLAHGQTGTDGSTLPGIDDDIDGRDVTALRATFRWQPTDRADFWVQYNRFRENDDRARITNQICARNTLPTTGCLPDGFGFDQPHLGATTGGIFAALAGALPPGADGANPAMYNFPKPPIDSFREMHSDFEPIFDDEEDLWTLGLSYDFDTFQVNLSGAYQTRDYASRQDYLMDVGPNLAATPLNPTGLWPTSEPAGLSAGADWESDSCNLLHGTAGIFGGCILPVDQTRVFSFDQTDTETEYWTAEARFHTTLDGPFNLQAGASLYDSTVHGDYYVLANTLDIVSVYGSPLLGFPPLYPGFFNNTSQPGEGNLQDGWAVFGEAYFDLSDSVKITAGLRYNEDNKEVNDTSVLFNSINANAALGGLFGANPIWVRTPLFLEMVDMASDPTLALSESSSRVLEFWDAQGIYTENAPTAIGGIVALGAAQQIGAAVAAGQLPPEFIPGAIAALPLPPLLQGTVAALLSGDPAALAADPGLAAAAAAWNAIAGALPPVPGFGETRFVTGSPSKAEWTEVSGRIGIDWQINSNSMVYGFYSRGYKPGGFNPAIPPAFQSTSSFTFDAEQVDAIELGTKNTFLDGRLVLNGSFFLYDYGGLQVTRIRNNSSINDNIDADIMGIEIEGLWRPEALPGAAVDFAYGWLNAEVDGSQSLDPLNRTAGNSDYVLLKNTDPGSLTGVTYIAREAHITQAVVDAALAGGGALDIRNGTTVQSVSYPANANGVSIPAYFSRGFLNALGVETLDGLPVDLDGNQLPNSPEHTLRLGLAYTWQVAAIAGSLTARWDYYWQGDSYAREFNSVGDEIDSWDQHNASLIYESGDGRWTVKAWVRNIADDDNVTGKYLTSDTSGFFRNYFLTEPRLFGASFRFNFGNL